MIKKILVCFFLAMIPGTAYSSGPKSICPNRPDGIHYKKSNQRNGQFEIQIQGPRFNTDINRYRYRPLYPYYYGSPYSFYYYRYYNYSYQAPYFYGGRLLWY